MFFWYNQTFSLYDPGYYVESFFINASIYITKTKLAKRTCSISNLYIACSISALKAADNTDMYLLCAAAGLRVPLPKHRQRQTLSQPGPNSHQARHGPDRVHVLRAVPQHDQVSDFLR